MATLSAADFSRSRLGALRPVVHKLPLVTRSGEGIEIALLLAGSQNNSGKARAAKTPPTIIITDPAEASPASS